MISGIINYFQTSHSQYFGYLLTHLSLSFKALLIALIIGLPLGYLSYRFKFLAEIFQTSSQLLRIIPSLAVLFILIPYLGVGEIPALIALTFLALPAILMNTALGFYEVAPVMKEVGRGLGMDRLALFKRVELPLALPYILNGVKLALVEILASATLATYIGAGGLGILIFTGLGLYRMDLLVIGGASVTLLSLLSILFFDLMIGKVRRHG